jgi:quercetin dioxygenase-like cupin family protein
MRRILAGASALAMIWAVLSLTSASATDAAGVTTDPLARGTNSQSLAIPLQGNTDVVVVRNTFAVGGTSGWHSHPGGALVTMVSGQLTLYRAFGAHCTSTLYTAGQAFFERPSDVQNGVNEGTIPAVAIVTFPGVPVGGLARIDRPDPGCAS